MTTLLANGGRVMNDHMIETNLAREHARRSGMFAKVSADGRALVFYTGREEEPGTWLEAGRTLIDQRSGVTLVSRHAVNLIVGPQP